MEEKYVKISRGGGKRVQAEPQRPKKQRSPVKKAFWGLYKLLVVLSVIVVAAYIGVNLLIRQPTIPESPSGGQTAPLISAAANQDETDPDARVRREGVYNFVLLGKDLDSGNTDTIIIVSYDVPNQTIGMVSIPRDTAMDWDWWYPKINGAYTHYGPDGLKAEIQKTFGIPIDYYVYIDLQGFIALVDELEGVDVDIPVDMNYDDPYQNLHIHFTKGYQHLDGQAAMEAARYRHDNDTTVNADYTDVGRSAMQRQILVSLAKKVVSWNSLTRVKSFLNIFQEYIKTDLSTSDMLYFATHAIQVDPDTGVSQGILEGDGNAIYKGVSYCFVYEAEDILPVLNELVNPYNKPLTEEDLNLPVSQGTC